MINVNLELIPKPFGSFVVSKTTWTDKNEPPKRSLRRLTIFKDTDYYFYFYNDMAESLFSPLLEDFETGKDCIDSFWSNEN